MDYTNYIEHYQKDAETYNYQLPFDSPEAQTERRRAGFLLHLIDKKLIRPDAAMIDN